jgi:hypothetical protein
MERFGMLSLYVLVTAKKPDIDYTCMGSAYVGDVAG